MLETYSVKVWRGLAGQNSKIFRWMRIFPAGLWIAILVVFLVGGRLLWVSAQRPAHRQEIATAFGSVGLFYGEAQMNHDGSRFTYVATDATGFGLFLYDAATGRKQLVCEENNMGAWADSFDLHVWPWSPDDSAFIYSAHNQLILCPAATNQASVQLAGGANAVSAVVWLDPGKFIYATTNGTIYCVQRQPAGNWEPYAAYVASNQAGMSALTVVGTNAIAWLENNVICRIDQTDDMSVTTNPFVSTAPATPAQPLTNNLMLWLDASTLKQGDGTPVIGLSDLSPSRNDAVVNGLKPTYNGIGNARALHGKGTIHFATGATGSKSAGLQTRNVLPIVNNAPRSVFAVMRRDVGRQMLIDLGDSSGVSAAEFGIMDRSDCAYLPGGMGSDFDNRVGQLAGGVWHLLEVDYDGTNECGYANEALRGTHTCALKTGSKAVQIGLRKPLDTEQNVMSSDGDFAELLIYNTVLTPSERKKIVDYLNEKWFGGSQQRPVWLDPHMAGINAFNYSKETGQFLISRTENGKDSLWCFDPSAPSDKAFRVAEAESILDAQWIQKKDFAYAISDSGRKGVAFANASGAETARLLERGKVDWLKVTPDGNQMLFGGTVSNEPAAGIWQYNLVSGQLRSVIPYADFPSALAKNVVPMQRTLKMPSGRQVNYTIYPPADFNRHQHKKYPVLMGNTYFGVAVKGQHGRLWVPGIASCGAFVVVSSRDGWLDGMDNWKENVMGLYQNLIQDPCIDKQRVFLFGVSAETQYLSDLSTDFPGLWKGVILLNPSALPDFSHAPPHQPRPKILISSGGNEHQENWFKKYQAEALSQGVLVEFVIHPGEGHHLVGNDAQLERTKAIMHFICEE